LRPMLDTWNVVHRPITPPPCSSIGSQQVQFPEQCRSYTEIMSEMHRTYHKHDFTDDSRDVLRRA
jgi:hypothetical protein